MGVRSNGRTEACLGGLALGALGFLLWVGALPGLAISPSGTSVTGCDQFRDENAASVCPRLYCEKALREQPEIGDRGVVSLDQSFYSENGQDSMHVGKVEWSEGGRKEQTFVRCVMRDDTVVRAGPITPGEFNQILRHEEWP